MGCTISNHISRRKLLITELLQETWLPRVVNGGWYVYAMAWHAMNSLERGGAFGNKIKFYFYYYFFMVFDFNLFFRFSTRQWRKVQVKSSVIFRNNNGLTFFVIIIFYEYELFVISITMWLTISMTVTFFYFFILFAK